MKSSYTHQPLTTNLCSVLLTPVTVSVTFIKLLNFLSYLMPDPLALIERYHLMTPPKR